MVDMNAQEQGKKNRDTGLQFENQIVKMFIKYFRDSEKRGLAYRVTPPAFHPAPGDVMVESRDCRKMFFIIECKSRKVNGYGFINTNEIIQKEQFHRLMTFAEFGGRIPLYAIELRGAVNEAYLVPASELYLYSQMQRDFMPLDFMDYKLLRIRFMKNYNYALHDDLVKLLINSKVVSGWTEKNL